MPHFNWGLSLILRIIFGQNPDEKQAVVIFDVTIWRCADASCSGTRYEIEIPPLLVAQGDN
ncbi:hypothetical protein AL524_24505 [Citrobacter amalonaticus]|nr:hypothetical protein AL524_24505 [Citrobacter amalonaticus]PNP33592.1 hypothetical protein AL525_006770 [Citrobacter amalonaticus]HAU5796719.1 hypothetical protein [Citrobacter amalonaticus]